MKFRVGALQQHLRHPRVVVVRLRRRGNRRTPSFPSTRTVCGTNVLKAVPAETFGGDSLLHVVEPVAIRILRADHHGAGRARRRDAMARDGAVDAEHEAVVAQDLEVVGGPVARDQAFVVEHGLALVGRHREMAAVAIRRPGGVAGVAGHLAVGMRELRESAGDVAPGLAVSSEGFRPARFFVVVRIAGRDGVECLHDFPFVVLVRPSSAGKACRRAIRSGARPMACAAYQGGCRRRERRGPEVISVARCSIVPWQSTQSSSMAARGSP